MANPELGQKQVCPNCQAKFYDLNRRPAHCPKCDTEFDPMEEAVRSRRVRRGAGYAADEEESEDQVADKSVDGDEDEEDAEGSTPEIDQEGHAPILTPDDDDGGPGGDDAGMGSSDGDDDDDVLDDDDDDSVPFIEDEDDDDLDEELAKPSRDDD